ncbi:MAG: ABC transporter substrate-binding protein [Lachnospiraceae bacterium]|nr:ABC transporter substrate-binding protein [Lachnospiraceae bacterium]
MRRITGLFLATAVLLLSACSQNPTESGDEGLSALTIAITSDENTLSPFTYVSGTGLTVNRLIYDTLFTVDLENRVIPWMVEEDYTAEDSRIFTFTLRDGLRFHDGDPVTAEDVKFSYEYPAKQNVSGQRKICNQIEKIEALDEKTVRFTLKETNVNFMRDGFAYIRILNDATFEGREDGRAVTETVGSGMYRLAEYKTGEYYRLEAAEDYFRGTPGVKSIYMPILSDSTAIQQALLAGELAASTGSVGAEMQETFEAADDLTVFSNAGYTPLIVNINNDRYPFDRKEFRQALGYAVDVNGICEILFGGYALPGTKGAVRSDLSYAMEGLAYEYSPEKAVEILEGLGYTEKNGDGVRLDEDGKPLRFTILTYSGNAIRSRACELMKEQLKKAGIELDIRSLDMDTADAYIWPDFEVANGRDYDLSIWGWSTANSLTYLISLCSSDFEIGTYNVCGYASEAFDGLVEERLSSVRTEADMEELLRELQAVIAEEVPLLTIAYPDTLQVCNTAMYDGWKAGKGANVVNIFSFLRE